jgi:pimeloyl-ACP methyl ester carboxylesterase
MENLQYNNGNIAYDVFGEGEPIVFIHGFGLDSRVWKPQVQFLSKEYKVITYDLRGFGNSSIPDNKYSHVDDLKKLLDHLNVESANLVGHSFGSAISIDFALKYPKLVEKLILIAPSISGYNKENKLWKELSELGRKEDIVGIKEKILSHNMFEGFKKGSEELELIERIIKDYKGWHFLRNDPREEMNSIERLEELNLPIKIIIGNKDSDIQMEVVEKLRKEVNAKIEVIENSGHMVNLEKPDIVNDLISSFTVL